MTILICHTDIFENETIPAVTIIGDFAVTIDSVTLNSTSKDIKPFISKLLDQQINHINQTILEGIQPIIYLNISGYTTTISHDLPLSDITEITKYVFLPHKDRIIEYIFEDSSHDFQE